MTYEAEVKESSEWEESYAFYEDQGNYYGVQEQPSDYVYPPESYSDYQVCGSSVGQLSPATTVASSSSLSPLPSIYTFEPQQVDFSAAVNLGDAKPVLNLPPKRLHGKKQKRTRAVSADVWAKRRKDANARERKRMTGLNEAFSRLRGVLGSMRDRPLSKMEALQTARQRILELQDILQVKN